MELARLLRQVLEFQRHYHKDPTPLMRERNRLINRELPIALHRGLIQEELAIPTGRLQVNGSSGSGLNAKVPLVQVTDSKMSTTPRKGWYLVLLFAGDGSSVFASLNKTSTEEQLGSHGQYVPVPLLPSDTRRDREWALSQIAHIGTTTSLPLRKNRINLRARGSTGEAYERTHVAGLQYDRLAIPDDDIFLADLTQLTILLRAVYDALPESSTEASTPKQGRPWLRGDQSWLRGDLCGQHEFPWCAHCRPGDAA